MGIESLFGDIRECVSVNKLIHALKGMTERGRDYLQLKFENEHGKRYSATVIWPKGELDEYFSRSRKIIQEDINSGDLILLMGGSLENEIIFYLKRPDEKTIHMTLEGGMVRTY